MVRTALGRHSIPVLIVVSMMLRAAIAGAGTPTVVWQKTGLRTGLTNAVFSSDGTALLLANSTGFEVRRASDGALLNTLNLPAASRAYDAAAFSPDKTLVALSLFTNGAGTIELWRVSNSTLARTITTDAVRSIKGLSFSTTGLIASRERFAYGGGGFLRVSRVSDGSLVTKLGPVARNSASGGVGFSPNAQYLAVEDTFNLHGLWILRTSDWGTVRTISNAGLFNWVTDSASLWTDGYQQVRISDGTVLKTVPLSGSSPVTSVTPDNRFLFAWDLVNGSASNTLRFLRTTDGGTQLVYTLSNGTVVWSNQVNSSQTLFTYEICPSDCTLYVATMPAL
jgi:hypothetical protein